MFHPLRNRLSGFTDYPDRLWRVVLPDGTEEGLTDYNWEVVGRTKRLAEEYGIIYSDNVYYWLPELERRGCRVEEIDDRSYLGKALDELHAGVSDSEWDNVPDTSLTPI